MAAIRNLVISILRLAGHASIARALRHTGRDPARAFRLLTGRRVAWAAGHLRRCGIEEIWQ
jgi:hypothetical protein